MGGSSPPSANWSEVHKMFLSATLNTEALDIFVRSPAPEDAVPRYSFSFIEDGYNVVTFNASSKEALLGFLAKVQAEATHAFG